MSMSVLKGELVVMRMHDVPTLWAATDVHVVMATLEMALPVLPCTIHVVSC